MKKKGKKKAWELTRHGKKWTQREEYLLRKLYPALLNSELVERLGRTVNAILGKAHQIGLRKNWRRPNLPPLHDKRLWTQTELTRIRQLYPTLPVDQLLKHFPKRSKCALNSKAAVLGLRKNYLPSRDLRDKSRPNLWRKQKELLIKLYPTKTVGELAELFGRSESAIRSQVCELGLHKPCYVPGERNGKGGKYWTVVDDELLRKLYPTARTRDVAARLDRPAYTVRERASSLGLKKDRLLFTRSPEAWSAKDIQRLKCLWRQGHTKAEIAKMMGRSFHTVDSLLRKLTKRFGLQKRRERPEEWSKADTKYLIANYHKESPEQLVERLGRTKKAIQGKAVVLRITQPPQWSSQDIRRLQELWQQGRTMAGIAKEIGKTVSSVAHELERQRQHSGLQSRQPSWSENDVAYLVKHYKDEPTPEICDVLGRTIPAVRYKAKMLNLKKRTPVPPSSNHYSKPPSREEHDV